MHAAVLVLFLSIFLQPGCSGRSTPLLDPASRDSGQDHWTIAAYYSRQAAVSRQEAEVLNNRVAVYERLFGPESEWVTGTRLLAQFYEEAAHEQDRLADLHLELGGGQLPHQSTRSRGH
jgi:hypothetical protein